MTNLLSNAIKFTSKGSVTLTATAIDTPIGEKRVIFMVEDTGIGIKEDVLKSLFVPFQQGDSSTARLFGGSGLGLSISRSLAHLMNGHIELASEGASGTTATFSIPLAVAACHENAKPTTDGPRCLFHHVRPKSLTVKTDPNPARRPSLFNRRAKSYQLDRRRSSQQFEEADIRAELKQALPFDERKKTHILLAEDNPVNRLIAVRAIEKLGFSVSAVWNGKEALDYLSACTSSSSSTISSDTPSAPPQPTPDLVLMDVQMPVMDGYKAASLISSLPSSKGLPIIAMTASAIQGDREKCFDAGMSDYLSKPVDAGALEAMLVKWTLARRRVGSVSGRAGEGRSGVDV